MTMLVYNYIYNIILIPLFKFIIFNFFRIVLKKLKIITNNIIYKDTIIFTMSDNEIYYDTIPFGTIMYEDDKAMFVSIDDPILFCQQVTVWSGVNDRTIETYNGKQFWSNDNRTEDKKRSYELAEYIKTSVATTEGINIPITWLSISQKKKNDMIVYKLWDGQHRRAAIKLLSCDLKYHHIIKSKFKCIIYKDIDTEESIIEKFINFNSSVPVSQTIIKNLQERLKILKDKRTKTPEERAEEKRRKRNKYIAETISNKLGNEFSEYCKTTPKPILPHFNKDHLTDDLMEFLNETPINITTNNLYKIILTLNDDMAYSYTNTISSVQIKKRLLKISYNPTKLYLFVESDNFTSKLIEYIESVSSDDTDEIIE